MSTADLTPAAVDIVELQILPEHHRNGMKTVLELVFEDATREGRR